MRTRFLLAAATAPLALALADASASGDPADAIHVRGTIVARSGDGVTVDTGDGHRVSLRLASEARIFVADKASLADVAPGSTVGIVNVGPNGLQDALEVHVFPDAMRGVEDGQRPWDLGRRSRLTTGTAGQRTESFDGQNVTLTYAGGESTIQVRPNTPVARLKAADAADLATGAPIFARAGRTGDNGPIVADEIIVGRGARPAM